MAVIRFPPNQSFQMKPHVLRFADAMEEYFGGAMNWGTYAGHSPPEGPTQALDHFNPNSPSGHRQQDKAADWAIKNARKYGLRYVIKRYEIWNIERADEGWRPRKRTGNPTVDHLDHNHYTFYAVAASIPDEPTPAPTRKRKSMEITYIANGQDFVFSSSSRYHGVLPNGATLDGLKRKKGLDDWGNMGGEFHSGLVDFATRAGFTRSYE